MEVLEGESLCASLGWLEGRRSKSNWLLLLPSSCGFTSFSANDWQLLYYGQTLKDKLTLLECVRVSVSAQCVCVWMLWMFMCGQAQSDSLRLKSTLQMWREAWVHLRLIQSASAVCVEWLLLHIPCHPEGSGWVGMCSVEGSSIQFSAWENTISTPCNTPPPHP